MRDDDERVAAVLNRTALLSDELCETVAELVELLTRHQEGDDDS